MTKRVVVPIIFLFYSALSICCNLEVDTSDPQLSESIEKSKQDHFFIAEYSLADSLNRFMDITEVWAEHVWFNKVDKWRVSKQSISGIQLNLKVDNFYDSAFELKDYMRTWIMKDDNDNFVGQSNGLFNMSFKDKMAPEVVEIIICKFGNDGPKDEVSRFKLIKKR